MIPNELKAIPNQKDYIRKYYIIPNYRNNYDSAYKLAIAKSTRDNGNLGLFAFVNNNDRNQILKSNKNNTKILLFNNQKLTVNMNRSLTFIDDYGGTIVKADTAYALRMKINELPGNFEDNMLMFALPDNAMFIAPNPDDCYARYIQDHRDESKYNCEITDFTDTHKFTLIATKNIYADDELFCDYKKITKVTNEDQRKQKLPTLETDKIDTPMPKK